MRLIITCQNELEASFLYEDTPDQFKSTQDVKARHGSANSHGSFGLWRRRLRKNGSSDSGSIQSRLRQQAGSRFGANDYLGHGNITKTFKLRLKDFPVKVDYINRFKTNKEQKETLQKVKSGEVDILIGTHRIVGKDVKFNDLGLMVIDEEQKFGVSVKDKLKLFKSKRRYAYVNRNPNS